MTVQQLLAWMNLASAAIPAGTAAVAAITQVIKAIHGPQMSDADMNAALALIFDDASRRKALALNDALGQTATA